MLFNLVLNSRDAMPEGGDITHQHRGVAGTGEQPAIGIVVADTGVGMDAETLERCREPFFTTKGKRGIGLGLGTVSTIVERSGGRLDIASEPGRGTTISAFFPVARGAAPEVELAAPLPHRARVLLVDDDVAVRGFAYKALNDAGYDVTSVDDAEEALKVASANGGYDLIVSDVVLPGMNGLDLVRSVRRAVAGHRPAVDDGLRRHRHEGHRPRGRAGAEEAVRHRRAGPSRRRRPQTTEA